MHDADKRLTIVQYAGDFREAAERLAAGGEETYRAQRYTVDYVEALAGRLGAVTTITCVTDTAYDVVLPSGARAIGAGLADYDGAVIERLVESTRPTHLIVRAPFRRLMFWAIRKRCRTLMLLASSFNGTSLRAVVGRRLIALLSRSRHLDLFANHGRQSAIQLGRAGVDPAKIVPWDFPSFDDPSRHAVKPAASDARRIFYVGLLIREKGVDDLIEAVAVLRDRGHAVTLELAGKGDTARLQALAAERGLADRVTFLGLVDNRRIVELMRGADAVVVPSRWDYPEGLPLTIYETLCSRTPIIVSNHPMFVDNIVDGRDGLVFPERDVAALADAIERLFADPALYRTLSENALAAWQRLQLPVKWADMIDVWLEGGPAFDAWRDTHSIARLA